MSSTVDTDPKALPSPTTISEAANIELYDVDGKKVRFGTLFEEKKVVVVFIKTTSIPTTHIFANPDRSLFRLLGMTKETTERTPQGEERKGYVKRDTLWDHVVDFAPAMMKNWRLIGKHGNHGQLGGDFVFGPGPECSFASRMRHTEDHVEIPELMKAAGVEL
ncbi:hypothetical protein CVT24_001535 [Panaeolus cyanescens]|uniref:Alkyl hydroperoxide reductase subunit C/ Thiol specific antioxidant domain-containing protein n=1 Tax=Panaeolus cyanescens TaxID=181874 RepID=A0A409YYT4_9AGAR|nr:hypothetical protein CVT24_001535 [Panaeolus cyanescens]